MEDWKEKIGAVLTLLKHPNRSVKEYDAAETAIGEIIAEDRLSDIVFTTPEGMDISAEDLLDLIDNGIISGCWVGWALRAMQAEETDLKIPAGVGAAWDEKSEAMTKTEFYVDDQFIERWTKSGKATVHPVKLSDTTDDQWALFFRTPKPEQQGRCSVDMVPFRKGPLPMTPKAESSLEKILEVLLEGDTNNMGEHRHVVVSSGRSDKAAIMLWMVARWLKAMETDGKGADARPERVKIIEKRYRWRIARAVHNCGTAMSAIEEIEGCVGVVA
jgi:hypothetical protein